MMSNTALHCYCHHLLIRVEIIITIYSKHKAISYSYEEYNEESSDMRISSWHNSFA